MANPILTTAGRAYIADRDANNLPVNLTEFRLGNPAVGGSTPTDPLPAQTTQGNVVFTGAPTAEGVDPNNLDSVIYSLLIGTGVGDFDITQIGLWSDTGVLVWVANIPTYHKRKVGAGVLGNNFVLNANIIYGDIVALTGMLATAETWQQDFTALLARKVDKGDIRVGTVAQVATQEATHEINDLDDVAVPAGSKVVLLDGTHTLTANLSLSNADVEIYGETIKAILDFATFTVTLSGARSRITGGMSISGAGAGDLIGSADGIVMEIAGADYTVFALSNGARGKVLGSQTVEVLSGSGTWVKPSDIAVVHVTMVAGGGGGASGVDNATGGGGGGGGGYATFHIPLTANLAFSVGAGGAGGAATLSGGAGGDTTLGTFTTRGGAGGNNNADGGDGGGVGTLPAVAGSTGGTGGARNGGGGGDAGSSSVSGAGADSMIATGGTGGPGANGPGGGGASLNDGAVGLSSSPPAGFGGGAGGKLSNQAAADGAPGTIILTY